MTCPSQQGWKQPPQGPRSSPSPPSTLGHLPVSLYIRAGCSCIITGGQASRSRGDASPPNPWKGQSGERTPSSGLLAQPALHAMRLGSSHHSCGCIQPHWVPLILHSYHVFEVTNMLSVTATEPSSSQGFAEKNTGRGGKAAVEISTWGQSWWGAA